MQHPPDLHFGPPETGRQAEALELALGALEPEQRRQQGEILLREAAGRPLGGLAVASRGDRWLGAVCWQIQPGRAATIWPPGLSAGEPPALAGCIADAACAALAQQGIQFVQCLLSPQSRSRRSALEAAGFEHLAELYYMVSLPADFPQSAPSTQLAFEPYRPEMHDRFAAVVDATYRGTQDCPRLNGVRATEDVLAGYRGAGDFNPDQWLLIRSAATAVGCLILADYPEQGNYELVYMGVVPEARGRGWGEPIARYAQWRARHAGRERLVLAVDALNRPALGIYSRVGFRVWDQRSVLARIFATRG